MNDIIQGPVPPVPSPGPVAKADAPPVRLVRLLLGLGAVVVVFDFCFWASTGLGFSVAVYFPALAAAILANREDRSWKQTTRLVLALMAGAALASVIEVGFTNILVWLVLTAVLAGDTYFDHVESPWGRWLSQSVACIRAPGRVFWLGMKLIEAGWSGGKGWAGRIFGGCLLTLPALALTVIFGCLLSSGNLVFGSWTNSFFDSLWNFVVSCLNPGRIIMWFFVAFLALPLLRPVSVSEWWWGWTQNLPRLPEFAPMSAALLSSGLMLLVLNLLFFVANLADALFLWSGATLPPGVKYTDFVHHGVNTLIVTVILSAVVLATIFQQAPEITGRRVLRGLAYVWIAQNIFLLFSVGERLRGYILTYMMTAPRLEVVIFLVLVAAGFVLLTIKIAREKSLSWLVGGCVLAVFATFYITQFLNLTGWAADYNVARWEQYRDKGQAIDVNYLDQMGMPAWPALRRVRDLEPNYPGLDAVCTNIRTSSQNPVQTQFDGSHWREFSLRAWWNRDALDALLK